MASPIGCSVQHCCSKYGFTADDIPCVSVKGIDNDFIEKANHQVIDKARMLLKLISVRNGSLQVNLPYFESDMQFLFVICPRCHRFLKFFLFTFFVLRVRFHNKYKRTRQFHYQIDITELRPPECVQALCHVHQMICFESDVTTVNNGRETTQHPTVSCWCYTIIYLQYRHIYHCLHFYINTKKTF